MSKKQTEKPSDLVLLELKSTEKKNYLGITLVRITLFFKEASLKNCFCIKFISPKTKNSHKSDIIAL